MGAPIGLESTITMAKTTGQNPFLEIGGDREAGLDVRQQNVTAVMAVANVVKTSLGPVGLDKVRSVLHGPSPLERASTFAPSVFLPALFSP